MLVAVAVEAIGYPLFEIYGTRALAFGTSQILKYLHIHNKNIVNGVYI